MAQYILECIAFQLVFLIIYDLFLKRETFFQWNRVYLIGTYLLSLVLPWIKIEALKTNAPEVFQGYPDFLWNVNDATIAVVNAKETPFSAPWEYTILFTGMFLSTLFFGYKLFQIYKLRQKGEVHYFKEFTRIIISNSSLAFSFFKSIFLGAGCSKKSIKIFWSMSWYIFGKNTPMICSFSKPCGLWVGSIRWCTSIKVGYLNCMSTSLIARWPRPIKKNSTSFYCHRFFRLKISLSSTNFSNHH